MLFQTFIISNIIIILNILPYYNTEHSTLCDSSNDIETESNYLNNTEFKPNGVGVLCNKTRSSRAQEIMENDELNSIPDFDLTQIETGKNIKKSSFVY